MILLSVRNIRKHFGPEPVLDGVEFDVRPGQKIAIVGPNGTGKTTLLKIVSGLEEPDAGEVQLHSSCRMQLLEQHPQFTPGQTLWGEAKSALADLIALSEESERLAEQIAKCDDEEEHRKLGARFDHLQQQLQQRDAYHVDHKIERVLHGLGFDDQALKQPVEQLSGGQQNRVMLAKLLLAEPDLMLLDEPSNHLDIDATQWLEEFLVESRQAIIVVSHDRYFLDRVANRTLELLHGTVDSYAGNYSAYQTQKAERLEVQRRTFEKQQIEIAKLEDFVRKHHHGQKHAQAEDRRKKLERIERVDLPREIAAPVMGFAEPTRCGDVALRVERLAKRYDHQLFEDLTFDILRGEKWGILGPNGTGKTTLLRCLLDRVKADAGHVNFAQGVKVGYFDQRLDCLDPDAEVVDAIRPDHKEFFESQRRDLLARFGVVGDMVFQRVASLSGGERNRTALAQLAALDANFLILDEPTNHLDLWARESLERSLRAFTGTVLFVSHDRYFVNRVADHLLVVEPGRFRVIEGNYDTYLHFVQQGLAGVKQAQAEPSNEVVEKRKTRSSEPKKRKRRFPYRKVADLEQEIAATEAAIEGLHQSLADPELLRNGDRVKSAKAELDEKEEQLAQLLEHWEEASELN